MRIAGIRVEEGFLDHLRITFEPGLNVIVGARGTGKTSVIELIRYCLNLPLLTPDARIRGVQQAISVLEGGQVSVVLDDHGERLIVSREGENSPSTQSLDTGGITILAQNEVEAIAALPSSRRDLLDRFVTGLDRLSSREAQLTARLRSATQEICSGLSQLDVLTNSAQEFSRVESELEEARIRQGQLLKNVAATRADQEMLAELQQRAADLATHGSQLRTMLESLERLDLDISSALRTAHDADPGSQAKGSDVARSVHQTISRVSTHLERAEADLRVAVQLTSRQIESNSQSRATLERGGREIRSRLEEMQQGAGQLTRRVLLLEEQHAQYKELTARISTNRSRIESLTAERKAIYEELDDVRNLRHARRKKAAVRLNGQLRPLIKITVTRSSSTRAYTASVIDALKGSGIHYNQLAPIIAEAMSPLELAEAAEQYNYSAIVKAAGITRDRAAAVANALREHGTAEVVASRIDDGVALHLLDGTEYKSTDELSIGQRCTAVIPLLLSRHDHVLIMDQPEDHLDNAFVANTLVPALRSRHPNDQFIIATHNANIPVLGGADKVIILGSDGRRAHVVRSGPLDDPEVVNGISSLMEGGREAFARRAEFYSGNGRIG